MQSGVGPKNNEYSKISHIKRTKSQNLNDSAQSNENRCWVENEDVVRAAPTGDAPTTSEWSTILLLVKVWLILEVWRYCRLPLVTLASISQITAVFVSSKLCRNYRCAKRIHVHIDSQWENFYLSGAETRIFWQKWDKAMVTDALAPSVNRPSAIMVSST